jgi:hypothetical protein
VTACQQRDDQFHNHDAGTVAFQDIRKFPEEALEELGFTTCECTQVGELSAVLDGQPPDLTIAGLLPMTP